MNRIAFCESLKNKYHTSCKDFVIAEVTEIELKFIALFIGLTGIIYLKNNKELLSEILFQIGYKSLLAATKVYNACGRVKNYFVSSKSEVGRKNKTYVYDEVKVIKNGVRRASFETMTTFKKSSYLGNPTEYYDLEEVVEDEDSSCFFSSSVDSDVTTSPSSPSSSLSSPSLSLEPLFVMDKNKSDNTLDFKTFDFILHTKYAYPDPETSKQNYTKIYRTFSENDYEADNTMYEKSNAEMIICNVEIDGDGAEYEIDLSQPYNFNVVGNVILDEKFVYWYMLKKYNYAIEKSVNYKITCITKDVKTFQLDKSSSGLHVLLNGYEEASQ
jgi:hypothetical protein